MVPQPDDVPMLTQANEETYDQLISLIENTQGRLAPIIVACDDEALRKRVIDQYESEAWEAQIRPYRLVLGQEPSLRSGLETLTQQQPHLQRGGKAVFTVTGAEMLLRVKLNPQDEQSELDKFFGYLQWTREGLREFRYPIVLWVTYRILLELSRRSADFWSWRKAVLRFEAESPSVMQNTVVGSLPLRPVEDDSAAKPLPPLAELQAEIAALTAKDPDATGLATLYDRLGQVYAQRVRQGIATNLEQESEHAITAFQQAITRYQAANNQSAQMWALTRLGNFFTSQSRYLEAIDCHQKSLKIAQAIGDCKDEAASLRNLGITYLPLRQHQRAIDVLQQSLKIQREIGDRNGEASSLENVGNVYNSLNQYQQAISFYQQALEIDCEVGNRNGEASSLRGLGVSYYWLGQSQQAISFYQQALEIEREVGSRYDEAPSLNNLGLVYFSFKQYQRAIYFYKQAVEIDHKTGNRYGEAISLCNIADALAKLGQSWESLQHYQKAKQIFQSLEIEHWIERCETEIYGLNQIIPVQQLTRAPEITPSRPPLSSRNGRSKRLLWVYSMMGVTIVLLIWWLKQ